jgi:inosine-uridine nucleoside N-ribohydrolase
MTKHRSHVLLIDTDTGVDDALALAYAFRSPSCAVAAVTTVAGNVEVEKCTRNVFAMLARLAPLELPIVAQGARRPLRWPLTTAPEVHGRDGLGNTQPIAHAVRTPAATDVIVDTCRRYGKRLTLVAIGPLTNIARAVQKNARALRSIRRIVSMGGAFRVPGNTGPVAEFNYFVDPQAAEIVLNAGLPLTVVPLDVTEQCALLGDELRDAARKHGSELGRFFVRMTRDYMRYHQATEGFYGGYLHDPLAVAVALDPTLVTTLRTEVHVECRSALTRGMTVADFRVGERRSVRGVDVAIGVDRARFLQSFFERVL